MSESIDNMEIYNAECGEIKQWDELTISPELLRGIYSMGFENPSPIQKKAILPILSGRDLIVRHSSGTGKTGCFVIGALGVVDLSVKDTQVLILSPTRELARQTFEVVEKLSSFMEGIRLKLIVGGTSVEKDIGDLRYSKPHVVVGCPGRVNDMIKRRYLRVDQMKLVVIDEADEMLSYGFMDQIQNIYQYTGEKTQMALFSATMGGEMVSMTHKFMRDPVKILVKTESLTLEGISQYFIAVENDNQKYDVIKDLYKFITVSQCIIYCNSVKRVVDLYDWMKADGFPVCCIHSSMTKQERDDSYNEFKTGKYRIMISSNVTARGIDIQQISVVINFDVPKDIHTYLHRIGRSGRWGRKGIGLNLITQYDVRKIREIERYYRTEINEMPQSAIESI